MRKKNAYLGDRNKASWLLAIILAIVPLIVRMRVMEVPSAGGLLWGDGGEFADFFSANKLIVLGVLTVIAIILFIKEYKLDIKFNKIILASISTYLLMAILSTLFASKGHKVIALVGAPGRYEGLLAILAYVILFVIAIRLSQNTSNLKILHSGVMIGAVIMSVIGLTQFLGIDILQTDGGKALMLPHKYLHMAEDLSFSFTTGQVYGTVFNPNYVGSYAAMLLPISVVTMFYTYLYSEETDKKIRYTVVTALILTLLLTSRSRGGLVGSIVALVLIAILLGSYILKTKKQFVITLVAFIIGILGINFVSDGVILKRITSLPKEVKRLVVKPEKIKQLTDIRLEDNAVEIDSNLPSFRIEQAEEGIVFIDDKGDVVEDVGEDKLVPGDDRYKDMNIEVASPDDFKVHIKNPGNINYNLHFYHTDAGFKIVGAHGKLLDIEEVDSWGFEGKERLGSGRGYIWSRTIPMIGKKWLLGYGLDTYPIVFPQHDIIGKSNAYRTTNITVDKPHNLYLQTMVSTGVPSLIALAVLFITYLVLFIKHLMATNKDDIRRWMSIAIFAALSGYLVAGLFNDSVISVAPVFWILWGVGVGLTQYKSSTSKVS